MEPILARIWHQGTSHYFDHRTTQLIELFQIVICTFGRCYNLLVDPSKVGSPDKPPIPPDMSSFFFSTPVDIDVVLEDTDDRQTVDVKLDKTRRDKAPLYMDGESVKGAVTVRPKDGRRLEHTGIKVQFIGLIGEREWSRRQHWRDIIY